MQYGVYVLLDARSCRRCILSSVILPPLRSIAIRIAGFKYKTMPAESEFSLARQNVDVVYEYYLYYVI
jgi:hypothetical protein